MVSFALQGKSVMRQIIVVVFLLAMSQVSCVVAGYSNRGGWFVWPGGLGLLLVIAVLFLLARRRR